MNEVVRNQVKISAFLYILPDKFVCVFYCALLPRGVGVSKIHLCIQCVGYSAVVAELRAVVSGYRAQVFPVRQKKTYGGLLWTVVDAHPVRYVANLCFVSHHDMAAVVGAQLSALVGADTGIDGLVRYAYATERQMAGYLSRRPILRTEQPQCLLQDIDINGTVAGTTLLSELRILLSDTPAIIAEAGAVLRISLLTVDGLTFICRAMALWLLPSWIPR